MEIFEAVRILIMFALSFITALLLTPLVLHFLEKHDIRKRNIRSKESAPVFHEFHKDKSGTVTMAGIVVWLTVLDSPLSFLSSADF